MTGPAFGESHATLTHQGRPTGLYRLSAVCFLSASECSALQSNTPSPAPALEPETAATSSNPADSRPRLDAELGILFTPARGPCFFMENLWSPLGDVTSKEEDARFDSPWTCRSPLAPLANTAGWSTRV